MPFLRCIDECIYVVAVSELLARYVVYSLRNLSTVSLELVPLDTPLDQLPVYSHINYWVKDTIF